MLERWGERVKCDWRASVSPHQFTHHIVSVYPCERKTLLLRDVFLNSWLSLVCHCGMFCALKDSWKADWISPHSKHCVMCILNGHMVASQWSQWFCWPYSVGLIFWIRWIYLMLPWQNIYILYGFHWLYYMKWEAVLHEPLFLFSVRIVAFDLIKLHLEYFDTFWRNFYI